MIDMDQKIQNLILANKILLEDAVSNEDFSTQDKELLRDRLEILIHQLAFWTGQDNKERFCYDSPCYKP